MLIDFDEYQKFAKTGILPATLELGDNKILIFALGLGGETGEVEDLIKKGVGHGKGIDIQKVTDELGDLMWYVANICTELDINMEDILTYNMSKLKERYPAQYDNNPQPCGLRCNHCGAIGLPLMSKNGPHIQAGCQFCGKFIKFLSNKEKEEFLNVNSSGTVSCEKSSTDNDADRGDKMPWD